jgi:alkylated DNA repair dioxygenase AlkB
VPRLVAVQGEVAADGSFPIYRHPADETPALLPFSPTVEAIRRHVEQTLNHPVNHVLIQHYRSGADYISEHSDKTIDVVPGSKIVNVSLGAQRAMTLRTKRDAAQAEDEGRVSARVPLPHNSMFVMGLETNRKWLHSVRTDKRPEKTKSAEERFENGERISLTFRRIGTFLSADQTHIYGQGAKGKTKEDATPVVNGGPEAAELLSAFGHENQSSGFDWQSGYGAGFDVLHFTARV